MNNMEVPFFTNKYQEKLYGKSIRDKIDKILSKGSFILGEEVKTIEQNISSYTGLKHAIGVANGSDALYISLKSLNLPENSEVITTPFTFFASTACIVRNNLKPVFTDVDENTNNIDVSKIEEKINKNTSCILPVDLFSQTANYEIISKLAIKYNLKVMEDSAEAFGMKWEGQHAGKKSNVSVLSFYPTKTLSCSGDGGMILTDDENIASFARKFRVHGSEKKYIHKIVGINSRLDEIQAGILNIKMDYVENEIKERESIAKKYFDQLKNIQQIKLPSIEKKAAPVWYVFSIHAEMRDELQQYLKERGIGTFIYYPLPMHLQECFSFLGYKNGDFPIAEKLCKISIALPVFIGMSDMMIEYVCENIKKFYKIA
jgi:UDP-2-acetamido-2-deoxy-ribo-hexuluronate aminotransferase